MLSRFDWFPRNRFAADARNQNGAALPNAARPGEFAGQNSEAKWDDAIVVQAKQSSPARSIQRSANRADEKIGASAAAISAQNAQPISEANDRQRLLGEV